MILYSNYVIKTPAFMYMYDKPCDRVLFYFKHYHSVPITIALRHAEGIHCARCQLLDNEVFVHDLTLHTVGALILNYSSGGMQCCRGLRLKLPFLLHCTDAVTLGSPSHCSRVAKSHKTCNIILCSIIADTVTECRRPPARQSRQLGVRPRRLKSPKHSVIATRSTQYSRAIPVTCSPCECVVKEVDY